MQQVFCIREVGYGQKLDAGTRVLRPKLPSPDESDPLRMRLPDLEQAGLVPNMEAIGASSVTKGDEL